MKLKKLVALMSAFALSLSLGVTTFAGETKVIELSMFDDVENITYKYDLAIENVTKVETKEIRWKEDGFGEEDEYFSAEVPVYYVPNNSIVSVKSYSDYVKFNTCFRYYFDEQENVFVFDYEYDGETILAPGFEEYSETKVDFESEEGYITAYFLENFGGLPFIIMEDKGVEAPQQPVAELPQTQQPVLNETAEGVTYTVQYGDTLRNLALNYYGSYGYSDAIYNANKEEFAKHNGHLMAGMTLKFPDKLGKAPRLIPAVANAGETLYTVQYGDTLGKIAYAKYGKSIKYKEIFERNKDRLSSPNKVYAGQIIVLPNIQ